MQRSSRKSKLKLDSKIYERHGWSRRKKSHNPKSKRWMNFQLTLQILLQLVEVHQYLLKHQSNRWSPNQMHQRQETSQVLRKIGLSLLMQRQKSLQPQMWKTRSILIQNKQTPCKKAFSKLSNHEKRWFKHILIWISTQVWKAVKLQSVFLTTAMSSVVQATVLLHCMMN